MEREIIINQMSKVEKFYHICYLLKLIPNIQKKFTIFTSSNIVKHSSHLPLMSNQIKFESNIFTFFGIISNPKLQIFTISLQSQVLFIVWLKVCSQNNIYIYEMGSSYTWCNSKKVTHFLNHWI